MKSQSLFAALLLILLALALPGTAARADSVLYDRSSFVQGQQSFVQSCGRPSPQRGIRHMRFRIGHLRRTNFMNLAFPRGAHHHPTPGALVRRLRASSLHGELAHLFAGKRFRVIRQPFEQIAVSHLRPAKHGAIRIRRRLLHTQVTQLAAGGGFGEVHSDLLVHSGFAARFISMA